MSYFFFSSHMNLLWEWVEERESQIRSVITTGTEFVCSSACDSVTSVVEDVPFLFSKLLRGRELLLVLADVWLPKGILEDPEISLQNFDAWVLFEDLACLRHQHVNSKRYVKIRKSVKAERSILNIVSSSSIFIQQLVLLLLNIIFKNLNKIREKSLDNH